MADQDVVETLVWKRGEPLPGAKLAAYFLDGYYVGRITFELVKPVPSVRAGRAAPVKRLPRTKG